MNLEDERIFVDTAMDELLAAEAHVRSLEQDVETYKSMLSEVMTRLQMQTAQVDRLMWRLRNGR